MRKVIQISLLASMFFLTLAAAALADGLIVPRPRPREPIPPLRSLAIRYHRVSVTIENQVATTHVDQVFVNDNGYDIEGEYIFPLPEGASISQFVMWVDGRRLEAEVLDRDKARQVYEDIVREQRDPALLEYVGRNAFRARIYPIPARGEKRVEIEYGEVLAQDQGLVKYVYPLNTEKFSSRPLEEVRVDVRLASRQPLKAIYSPSHEISVRRSSDLAAEIGYRAQQTTPDKDFVLYYTVSADDLGVNLMSYKPAGEEGFFLLLLAPRAQVDARQVIAKDVFFVLDISGSMRGDKLKQAQRAALYVLDNLGPQDRFNIIAFETSTHPFASGLRPISETAKARAFVEGLAATGSTDINRALQETLAQADPATGATARPQVIVFLTDGLPTQGELRLEKIIANVDAQARDNVRLFAFGVGYDVNTVLLDTIAQGQRGASAYVRPEEDIEGAVSAFYQKISQPVLADVKLDWGTAQVEDIYPYPLPDVFAGGQMVVVGRYRNAASTVLTLSGTVNGQSARYTYDDMLFRGSGGADFIPRLWATRKIGYLLTQIRLHGSQKELVDQVVELSVRYGIVTPYTSFLIDETEDALSADGRRALSSRDAAGNAAPQGKLGEAGRGGGGMAPLASAPTQSASGAKAVEKSMAQEALRQADVAAAPQTEQVRPVGDKTFVLRDGVWTDTTFDTQTMRAERVAFGSERYFELTRAHPEWGRYLALGSQVVLVAQGQAYHIGAEGAHETEGARAPQGEPTATPPMAPSSYPAPDATPTPTPASAVGLWERVFVWWRQLRGKP